MGPGTQARLRCRRAESMQFVRCNQQCVQRPLLGGWVTKFRSKPGTRAEARLRAAEKLNQSMQAEARDTFAEFEASIGRDSVRHLVGVIDCRPVGFCLHLPAVSLDGIIAPVYYSYAPIYYSYAGKRCHRLLRLLCSHSKTSCSTCLAIATDSVAFYLFIKVADGTVHPLTAYSLSFLKRLFTYESSITVLFADPEATPGLARTCACCC